MSLTRRVEKATQRMSRMQKVRNQPDVEEPAETEEGKARKTLMNPLRQRCDG